MARDRIQVLPRMTPADVVTEPDHVAVAPRTIPNQPKLAASFYASTGEMIFLVLSLVAVFGAVLLFATT